MTTLHKITVDGKTIPHGELLSVTDNVLKTDTGEPWLEAIIGQLAAIKTQLAEQNTFVSPFALNSDALVTVPYRGVGQSTLDSAIQAYFSDWQDIFLTKAMDLPKPFLNGQAYRQWCFHAWVGEALLRVINVTPSVDVEVMGEN